MKKKLILFILAIFIFLGALGLTLYPLISTAYNEKHRSEVHTQYENNLMDIEHKELIEERRKAASYNRNLINYSPEAIQEAENEYKELLNLMDDGVMGYVEIPKINVLLPIYHGTNADTLEVGGNRRQCGCILLCRCNFRYSQCGTHNYEDVPG